MFRQHREDTRHVCWVKAAQPGQICHKNPSKQQNLKPSVRLLTPSIYHCFPHQQALDVIPWGWQRLKTYRPVSLREKQGRSGQRPTSIKAV